MTSSPSPSSPPLSSSPSSPSSSSSSRCASPSSPSSRARVDALRESVSQNGSYEHHLALVNALRQQAAPQALRLARERFALAHALDAQLWMQWLEDELSLAETDAQRAALLPLFERAMRDLLHVPLHALFVRTLLALWRRGAVHGDRVRDAFERSVWLGAVHHFTEGECLWRLYQHVAQQLPPPPQTPPLQQQPCYHSHTSELAAQCRAFEAKICDAHARRDAQQLIHVYTSYATFAHNSSAHAAVSVYERMLTQTFSQPAAWLHYLAYLTAHSQTDRLVFVSQRAIRNVPNSIPVWSHAVLAAQYDANPSDTLSSLIERAEPFVLTSDDYAAAEALSKHAWSVFLALGAPHHLLPRLNQCLSFNVMLSVHWASATCYAATVLASADHVQSAVQLFESVINARPTETRWRLQYANAMATKSEQSVRDIFQQGVLQLHSAIEANTLRDAWQAFEVRVATTDTLLHRLRHIDATCAKRTHHTPAVARDQHALNKRSKPRREKSQTSKKQKLNTRDQPQAHTTNQPTHKHSNAPSDPHNMQDVQAQQTVQHQTHQTDKPNNHVGAAQNAGEHRNAVHNSPEPNTVFVSNLPFNVNEEHLRQFFSEAGAIRQVRLPLRSDGAPKGIAYVEFENDAAVQSALKKHLRAVHGRTVSVKRSKPPQKKRGAAKTRASSTKRRTLQPRASGRRKKLISGIHAADKDVHMTDNAEGSAKEQQQSDHKPLSQDDFRAMLKG